MGMDVYGKNPTSEKGIYFRRNVWGWHPLWEYVENRHPEIAALVEYAHSNDGDGLDEEASNLLANKLREDLAAGLVTAYVAERNEALANLPMEVCQYCDSTGIRSDEVGLEFGMPTRELSPEQAIILGRTHGTCNACQGLGERVPFDTNYDLEETDIQDFAEFLEASGGFEIW